MQENDSRKRIVRAPGARITFSERNLNRWSIYGSRKAQIERVLTRENNEGTVVETCQIGAVGYKGRLWSLSSVHGRLMNIIEMLFFRQGMPSDNTVRISSIALYNYLSDAATLFNESKMKDRDGNRFRDWIYDTLHVLAQVTLMFSSWEKKDGSRSTYGFKLIRAFKMWGRDGVGLDLNVGWGMIAIMLDAEYANGLRERNTTPLLIETENSIKGDNAFALYRYLRQVLFKTPTFSCKIADLHKRLSIGRRSKSNMIKDFREAAMEVEDKEIPNGRIGKCEVLQKDGDWWLVATLDSRVERRAIKIDVESERRRAEEQRLKDSRIRETEYLAAFQSLDPYEKSRCQKLIDAIIGDRWKGGAGLAMHTEAAICEVMHEYFIQRSDVIAGRSCRDLMAREKDTSIYIGKYQRAAIQTLAQTLARYSAAKQGAIY